MNRKRGFMLFVILIFISLSFVSAESVSLNSSFILDDAYVDGGLGNRNFGLDSDLQVQRNPYQRTYIKFDISSIPSNQIIDNSQLCLYMYNDQSSQTVSASHVYVHDWNEGSENNADVSGQNYTTNISWNNQPCGVDFDNNSNCNLTAESFIVDDGTLDNSWQCWDIINSLSSEYESGDKNVSIVLFTEDLGNSDIFYSKEYTVDASLNPFLNVTYHSADIISPDIEIISPLNQSYTVSTILVNISASDPNLQAIWFYDGSTNITYNNSEVNYIFGQGSTTLFAYANDSVGNLNVTNVTFVVDSVAPVISIDIPEAKVYGINTSLPLNYTVSDAVSGVDSCWYHLDSGNNITLMNCQNTTFNISDGAHAVYVYANDSLNNLDVAMRSFTVLTTSPAVNLQSPSNNSYLNYDQNVYFNYTSDSGIGLSVCQLYGDFNGTFMLNQTDVNPVEGNGGNNFILNLSDGNYNWGVACNDTQNRFSMVNSTFVIDTMVPALTLSEPNGVKTSRTGIPLTFVTNDSSPISCLYNIKTSIGGDVKANTSISCSSTTFDVSADGNYVLNLFVNDSAGNINNLSSSFSVDTSTTSPPPSGGGTTGGSSGSSGGSSWVVLSGRLNLETINDLIATPGENKRMSLEVINSGLSFLNDCSLQGSGDNAGWISSSGVKKLGGGESSNFGFDLNIPENLGAGIYPINLEVACKERSEGTSFNIEIIEKQINFELIDSQREGTTGVLIKYILEELLGVDQEVEVQFILYDSSNQKVSEFTETVNLVASSREEFSALIPVEQSLIGSFNLVVNLNSEEYSSFVQESLVLGKSVGGFAIFDNDEQRGKVLISAFVISFFVFSAFMLVRIIRLHKKGRKTRDYSK